jgi:ATP-dependent RNA helicase SUPV3L1/SUV3
LVDSGSVNDVTGDRRGADKPRIVAVLGPTNTGKTHLAIERMLGFHTGMIGFPLRLLARENYDRIVRLKGASQVALITGEERIVPPSPRWYVCTVEAMPLERDCAFLAVDEIQMMADRERGHVFTDRLLHARGHAETMFLGAETARRMIRALVPGVEMIARPRFSTLSWTGPRKITRLPRRSAIVAFSAAEVYAIAELVRRQRGGASVVFGALSPRTRNAQVALYQAGDVDYLVATDAIGMGLNMDIDHVAFAALGKFDGQHPRRLSAAELAQIAGRAGRHMNDGTFGTTAESGELDAAVIAAIEEHRFPEIEHVFWRNSDLDFASPAALLASLERRAERAELIRVREADDHLTLAALCRDEAIMALSRGRANLQLLWDCAQIPDFRKTLSDAHARLVGQIFTYLRGPRAIIPTDWVAGQVDRLDRTEGDIDALVARIAHIRTWTYVSHRARWLEDARHWQERARAVEDRLSDALHERLTQRFVDRRACVLARKRKSGDDVLAAVAASGDVLVEGEFVGRLKGFSFVADTTLDQGARSMLAAANKALRQGVPERVRLLVEDADHAFALDDRGFVSWRGDHMARLVAGESILQPRIDVLPAELLDARHRESVRRRLADWLQRHLAESLAPLVRLSRAELPGPARGIAYAVVEALGTVEAAELGELRAALTKAQRQALHRLNLRLGEFAVWLPLSKGRLKLRALLWAIRAGVALVPPSSWPIFLPRAPERPLALMAACGYLPAGPLMIRADALERLGAELARLARLGPFPASDALGALIGADADQLGLVLKAMGYRRVGGAGEPAYERRSRRPRPAPRPRDVHSPFARLARLVST